MVCTDSVERNHWYRAIADVIERRVEEKEGRRREHNHRVEQAMDEQLVRSLQSTLTHPPTQNLPTPSIDWQPATAAGASGGEARDDAASVVNVRIVEDGDSEDEEQGAPPAVTSAGNRYSYADSDDEDFSPQPPPLSKDDEEEQKQPPLPSKPSPPLPSPFIKKATPPLPCPRLLAPPQPCPALPPVPLVRVGR